MLLVVGLSKNGLVRDRWQICAQSWPGARAPAQSPWSRENRGPGYSAGEPMRQAALPAVACHMATVFARCLRDYRSGRGGGPLDRRSAGLTPDNVRGLIRAVRASWSWYYASTSTVTTPTAPTLSVGMPCTVAIGPSAPPPPSVAIERRPPRRSSTRHVVVRGVGPSVPDIRHTTRCPSAGLDRRLARRVAAQLAAFAVTGPCILRSHAASERWRGRTVAVGLSLGGSS